MKKIIAFLCVSAIVLVGVAANHFWVNKKDGARSLYEVESVESITFVDIVTDEHDFVDLNLPSGTLWATCNVGADSPEEFGDYFSWGETEPKSNYDWSTYKYGVASNKLTKYCYDSSRGKNGYTDTLTVLQPMDDAATANFGAVWRMPTESEWNELKMQCTWIWAKVYGVIGCLVIGSNGNSIFLPAGKSYRGTSLNLDGCLYWSSTLSSNPYTSYGYCKWVYIGNQNVEVTNTYSNLDRSYGCLVRPVRVR